MNISSATTEIQTFYPFTFEPVFIEKVWAGNLLECIPENVGEVWTVVDRPGQESLVSNGKFRAKRLGELLDEFPEEILGRGKSSKQFPVLVKLIDAGDKLSVQVHPGEDGKPGSQPKSEMWYILDVEEESSVYVGFNDKYSTEEVSSALNEQNIVSLLNKSSPKKGDSYYIPAGTVHALGEGNLVLEIQQNSDSTYRLYDWDRVDDSGVKRDLHIEDGLASIKAVRYTQGANWEIAQPSFSLKEIIDTHWVTVFEVSGDYLLNCRYESCFIVSAVESVVVNYQMRPIKLSRGDSTLIPACLNEVGISGQKWLLMKVK